MSKIKNYVIAGSIIVIIIFVCVIIFMNVNKNSVNIDKKNITKQIYKDINTDKIYNPDDIFPSTPGKYSTYLKYLGNQNDTHSFTATKKGFLLNSISNLPPNKITSIGIYFNNNVIDPYIMRIQNNNEGILYFNDKLEALPIGLMNDISSIFVGFESSNHNTILNYEGIPKYSNVDPYNTPIANYTVISDLDIKNNYKLPYNMSILLTGVCPVCFDSNKKLISNVTFKETINAYIDGIKTVLKPVSGNIDSRLFCSKICQ